MGKFDYAEGIQERCNICGNRFPVSRMKKQDGGWRCEDDLDQDHIKHERRVLNTVERFGNLSLSGSSDEPDS